MNENEKSLVRALRKLLAEGAMLNEFMSTGDGIAFEGPKAAQVGNKSIVPDLNAGTNFELTKISKYEYEYRRYKIYPCRYISGWEYCHNDYDGPGDNRCGHGRSLREVMMDIDDLEDEKDYY